MIELLGEGTTLRCNPENVLLDESDRTLEGFILGESSDDDH